MIGREFSHYKVTGTVGAGGMGVVYTAEDVRLQRPVALKFLADALASDAVALARFQREARTASSLNHPHICTIYEVDTVDGRPFIAMELLTGETLKDRLRMGALSADEALTIAAQVADALDVAHDAGIVHRDVTPANIFLTSRGHVKVVDFGLAKRIDAGGTEDTAAGVTGELLVGTTLYMSPEQVLSQPLDRRSDLFSLGAALFEMLTHTRAFAAESSFEILNRVLHHDVLWPPQIAAKLPVGVTSIVDKLLQKDRQNRYQSARELKIDIDRVLHAHDPISATVDRAAAGVPSIAVLPFRNLGPDTDAEYLCDGLAEELQAAIAKLSRVRVASRTSAASFKGKEVDAVEIGERLQVSTLLEGSVRKAGTKLRVAAQLTDAVKGYQRWSERFDRTLDDVFAIQDEIAQAIVNKLELTFGGGDGEPIIKRYTANTEAYHLYLRGRYEWAHRYQGGLMKAIEAFEHAIRLDPDYAPAHAGLADVYSFLAFYSIVRPPAAFEKAQASVDRALAIDADLAEAHSSAALVMVGRDWDFVRAEQSFRRALDLDPRQGSARIYHAWVLVVLGRLDEAFAEARRAHTDEPMSDVIHGGLAYTYFLARRYDEAILECRRCLELHPHFLIGLYVLGMASFMKGALAEATIAFEEAATLSGRAPFYTGLLGACHARAGRTAEAQAIVAELDAMQATRYVPPHAYAYLYCYLGDLDRAFEYQARACEEGASPFNYLSPMVEPMQRDPRFAGDLARMGLRV